MRASSRKHRVDEHGQRRELDPQFPAIEPGRHPVDRPARQVVELEDVGLGSQGACLDAAKVEQVGDDPVEPCSTSRSIA